MKYNVIHWIFSNWTSGIEKNVDCNNFRQSIKYDLKQTDLNVENYNKFQVIIIRNTLLSMIRD